MVEAPVLSIRSKTAFSGATREAAICTARGTVLNNLKQVSGMTSIGLLPIRRLNSDSEDQTYCDLLTKELLSSIGQEAEVALEQIRRKHVPGVSGESAGCKFTAILDGAIQRIAADIRIWIRVTDLLDGSLIWSDVYRCQTDNFLSIAGIAARSAVIALRRRLTNPADDSQSFR